MKKITHRDIKASNYLKFSIPLFFEWLTQKQPVSPKKTKRTTGRDVMNRINSELKRSIHEMSDNKLTVRLLPMDQAMSNEVLSIRSACWIAQAYNLTGRMTRAGKEISKHLLYLLDGIMSEDEERIIRTYLNSDKAINYRVLNRLRHTIEQTADSKLKASRLSVIDTIASTDLYASTTESQQPYKKLYQCYQNAIKADPIFKSEYSRLIQDIFKNLN